MKFNSCKKWKYIKLGCGKDYVINIVFGYKGYSWIVKEDIKIYECFKFIERCFEGNIFRFVWMIYNFYFV